MDSPRQAKARAKIAKTFEGVPPYSDADMDLARLRSLIDVFLLTPMKVMTEEEKRKYPMGGYDYIIGNFGIKKLDKK